MKLNLGAGTDARAGFVNVDFLEGPGIDVVADLTRPLPFDDGVAEEFLLSHVLEHIPDTLALMGELWRIGKPGALVTARVPYGSSDDAWEDQTHLRAYFLQSWGYFSQPYHWRSLGYGYTADWQPVTVTLLMEEKYAKLPLGSLNNLVRHQRNVVREMVCVLRKVSPTRPRKRELQVLPEIGVEACEK
jgi:SAM-dependent methyltransferase